MDKNLLTEKRNKALESWEKLTTPEILKRNLILTSLYLSAFEILMNSIVDQLRDFYTSDLKNGKLVPNERYKTEVKNLHKKILHASCLWLQNNGVITKEDIKEIDKIREHRNEIAHELPNFLVDVDWNVNLRYLESIRQLVQKIDIWWMKEFIIPVNPDFDGVKVKDNEMQSGKMLLLDIILGIALDAES